jgi:hypothetical protein
MRNDAGQHLLHAKSDISKGQVIEKSVLRQCHGLDDAAPNPFILRHGPDFSLEGVELAADTPYLAAGAIMFYSTFGGKVNVELKTSAPNGTSSLEVDVVALEAIPAGTRLVRKGAGADNGETPAVSSTIDLQYSDMYDMTDEDLNSWFAMWAGNDLEDAVKANRDPEPLREDTIREHFRQSRAGEIPISDTSKTRVMPHPVWPGYGVFATQDIKEGEVVEYGLHRKIADLNGDKCPYVFTWNSHGKRRTQAEGLNQWGQGAGNIMFYNSDSPPNCRLFRLYGGWRFVLVARRDVAMGEELMHLYKSSSWRKCFVQDEYLPKEAPLEARSRTGSEQNTPTLGPQPEPDLRLNDGTKVSTPQVTPLGSPSMGYKKDPIPAADVINVDELKPI